MKVLVALLSLLCLGFLGLSVYQHLENGRLRERLYESAPVGDPESVLSTSVAPSLKPGGAERVAQKQVPSKEPSENSFTSSRADRWVEIMGNPALKEKAKSRRKRHVESDYGDLIEAFDFDDNEREHFVDLMAERALAGMAESMQMMATEDSAERAALAAKQKEKKDAITEQIEAFLNDRDDFERFQIYADQMYERKQMKDIRAAMATAGVPLEKAGMESLVEVMYEERISYPFHYDFIAEGGKDQSKWTRANVDRFIDEMQAVNRAIVERAAEFLDEAQLATFQANQEQMIAFQKMGMEDTAEVIESQRQMAE